MPRTGELAADDEGRLVRIRSRLKAGEKQRDIARIERCSRSVVCDAAQEMDEFFDRGPVRKKHSRKKCELCGGPGPCVFVKGKHQCRLCLCPDIVDETPGFGNSSLAFV